MIEVANISVKFRNAPTCALSDISFNVEKGEHIAILGPNGSGKSSLLKVLCGIIPAEAGEIRIFGKTVRYGRFGCDFFGDIGVVFQEPQGQFLGRDVKTEITAILQNIGLPHSSQSERFDEIVADFGLEHLIHSKPENLSGGQMQLVNLASAVCMSPQILLLDEPTTFLDPFYKADFLNRINALNKQGLTVIHITQYPDEALLASRVITLNGGKLVYDGPAIEFLNDEAMLIKNKLLKPVNFSFQSNFGFEINDSSGVDDYIKKVKSNQSADLPLILSPGPTPIIQIENLQYSYKDGSFNLNIPKIYLNTGEIVGLVGPGGSGKSTLAFLLAGLLEANEGKISIAGKRIAEYRIDELRKQIGITWQLPDLTMIGPTVGDDLEFNLIDKLGGYEAISSALHEVGLDGFENRIVDTLSGGEKRKLALSSILLANPQYLILDEPEAFLDPWSQQELIGVIRKIAGNERGILIIAHDLSFLSEFTDRIIGLSDGNLIFDIPAMEFFSNSAYLRQLRLPVNSRIEFRQKLVDSGINLKTSSLDPAKLKQSLE